MNPLENGRYAVAERNNGENAQDKRNITPEKSHNAAEWTEGRGWGKNLEEEYGQVLLKRAVGELPEMESSKAVARLVAAQLRRGESVLDVGCAVGHYLRSLRQRIQAPFQYMGVDSTPLYIELARKAHSQDSQADFLMGDIHALPFADAAYDVTICNNLLLHLPLISHPIKELCRVTARLLVIRTLIGERTFLIKEVRDEGSTLESNAASFNHYNIYSRRMVTKILEGIPRVKEFEIKSDTDFDATRINQDAEIYERSDNPTRTLAGWQVNGYILQPWCFAIVHLRD